MAGIKPKSENTALNETQQLIKDFAQGKTKKGSERKDEEFELQCAATTFMQLQFPNLYHFHIANERKVKRVGSKQTPLEGIRLKKAGVKKGNPDDWTLQPFTLNGVYYLGTVLELKAPGRLNNTSPEQIINLKRLKAIGYYTGVVDNITEYMNIMNRHYGKGQQR